MKVSRAIELLSEMNPEEEICISWWEQNLFTNEDGTPVSDDAWLYAVGEFDAEGGYEGVNEQVWMNINFAITGNGDF